MSYIRHPNTQCTICNKSIYKRPGQIRKNNGHAFCGIICYGKFTRKEKPCLVCGNLIMAHFNKKTCSKRCSNKHRIGIKYRLALPRKDKVRDYRMLKLRLLKLRGIKCETCGYSKVEILQVHHKDQDRNNNELENLELICPNCHFEQHLLKKSWLKGYNLHRPWGEVA